jgi:5-methylcytosine-specific restriction protein A
MKLIAKAKKRDNFICKISHKHITFISNKTNYVEGHHIIPMFQQKNYDFNLDDVNNIISLCPNCHREIHSADNKKKIIDNLYKLNKQYMEANNIYLNDLYKMYICA